MRRDRTGEPIDEDENDPTDKTTSPTYDREQSIARIRAILAERRHNTRIDNQPQT